MDRMFLAGRIMGLEEALKIIQAPTYRLVAERSLKEILKASYGKAIELATHTTP